MDYLWDWSLTDHLRRVSVCSPSSLWIILAPLLQPNSDPGRSVSRCRKWQTAAEPSSCPSFYYDGGGQTQAISRLRCIPGVFLPLYPLLPDPASMNIIAHSDWSLQTLPPRSTVIFTVFHHVAFRWTLIRQKIIRCWPVTCSFYYASGSIDIKHLATGLKIIPWYAMCKYVIDITEEEGGMCRQGISVLFGKYSHLLWGLLD